MAQATVLAKASELERGLRYVKSSSAEMTEATPVIWRVTREVVTCCWDCVCSRSSLVTRSASFHATPAGLVAKGVPLFPSKGWPKASADAT